MTDGTGRPEFFSRRIRDVSAYACIGTFDLKCDACETCAARLANEVGISFIDAHPWDTLDDLADIVGGAVGVEIE